jgi:chemotaxis protein MotA
MDMITILGLIVGIGGILGGMVLENGHLGSLLQVTAACIVFGGTFGAVLVSTTKEDLSAAFSLLKLAFSNDEGDDVERVIDEMIDAAQVARKETILALEKRLSSFSNPYMQNIFRYVIDGVEPHVIREIFEAQMDIEEENQLAGARVWTDAGGFAPTIGIIGAVLGLIHVMSNLTDTSKLGGGIAVAFVATVYGVGSANLIFLPIGNKIRRKIRRRIELKAMILEGAVGIMSGLNPFIIEEKCRSFLPESQKPAFSKVA